MRYPLVGLVIHYMILMSEEIKGSRILHIKDEI